MNYNFKSSHVFVVDCNGKPMMPTKRLGWVRHKLKSGEAKVFSYDPHFTIQLLNETKSNYKQEISMGMDCGYTIGISGIVNGEQIVSSEVKLRSASIKDSLKTRSSNRRNRRNRLRHRKCRFENRRYNIEAKKIESGNSDALYKQPTFTHFCNSHMRVIDKYNKILPVSNKNWTLEVAKFDTHKMKDKNVEGVYYQYGEKYGFTSNRLFVFERDNYTCQNPNCGNSKSNKDIKLVIHHIIYRSHGGTNEPSNLITLCSDCHTAENHKSGFLLDWMNKKKKCSDTISYKEGNSMNILRKYFIRYNKANPNNKFKFTCGSITKTKRNLLNLDKSHANDATAIAYPEEYIKKNIVLKNDVEIKVDYSITKQIKLLNNTFPLIQTNSKETGRRCLCSFFDAKYVTKNGEILSGSQTAKEKNHRVLIENKRLNRVRKYSKGKNVYSSKSPFPKNTIVSATIDSKNTIIVSGGVTNTNIYTLNHEKRFLAWKKYNLKPIAFRSGIIRNFDSKEYKSYNPIKK